MRVFSDSLSEIEWLKLPIFYGKLLSLLVDGQGAWGHALDQNGMKWHSWYTPK